MGNEMIDHPPHYGGDTQYEAIKVIEAWGLGFHLGNAVKYIARAGRKIGADCVADLRKAAWYLERAAVGIESPALLPWATPKPGQDASDALAMATVAAACAAAGTGPQAPRDDAEALLEKAQARAAAGAEKNLSRKGAKNAKDPTPDTKNWRRTWPKTCVICGKNFDAKSCSAKCCSAKCVDEKNRRYANAKYLAKYSVAKPTLKKAAKAVAALDGSERVCVACGKKFKPHRKDQKCCSTVCGKSGKGSHAPKVSVALAPAAVLADDTKKKADLFPYTCEVCGLGFNPRYPDQKTCSITCAKELRERIA